MGMTTKTIATCDRCKSQHEVIGDEDDVPALGRELYISETYSAGDYLNEEEFWVCNACLEDFRRFMRIGEESNMDARLEKILQP